MNILLEQEEDNDREIEIEEKTSDEFDLKYRTISFQKLQWNSREVRPSTSATAFVKLPTININSFDGEPENWHTFIDSLGCAIDKNNTLSDIEKMNYLKNLVGGKAATIISSIKLANENYNICLNLLKERYEDKQLMIHSHMNKLLKLENVTDVKDVWTKKILWHDWYTGAKFEQFGLWAW